MKEYFIPISLSQVLLNVPESDEELPSKSLSEVTFDCRHDFIVPPTPSTLAVSMVFTNERRLHSEDAIGARRPIIVSLIDSANGKVLATTTARVNITRGEYIAECRVSLPLIFSDICFEHAHKVVVRDGKTGIVFGEKRLHFFSNQENCRDVSEWFDVIYGGASADYHQILYKSFEAELFSYYTVVFNLKPALKQLPKIVPEMEIRIHFPNGAVESRFCRIEDDYDYKYGGKINKVLMPFFMDSSKKGICYAELICMDYALAGFVFSTDSKEVFGPLYPDEMECLDEYSLASATKRFRETIKEEGTATGKDENVQDEEDPFDKALQEFIDSQTDDTDEVNEASDGQPESEAADAEPQEEPAEGENQSIMVSLNRLTGLTNVKKKLATYEKVVQFNKLRSDNNLPVNSQPLHAMFLGSPGTGKTTVAKSMGIMLRRAGLLSKGHVVVKERATLLGPNYSMEESNTLQAIEEAQGGILLIDEAYQLYQANDPRDPGRFVIETLMTALADESKRDWMLILAGYPDEMRNMYRINLGLESRIPKSNIYLFEDFSESELMEIAENYLERNNYSLSAEAHEALRKRLAGDCSNRDKKFGNARHVINMIQTEILPAMAVRVVSEGNITSEELSLIRPSDIPAPVKSAQSNRPRIGFCA